MNEQDDNRAIVIQSRISELEAEMDLIQEEIEELQKELDED